MALIIKADMPCNCMNYCQFCGNDMVCKLTGEEISSYDGQFGRMDFCPLVEIPDEHGRLVDIDKMISDSRKGRDVFPLYIESMDDLADFLETYADLDKTDHTVVVEASK